MRPSTGLTALAAFSALSLFHIPQQRTTPDFRPLEFLVGHCWVGTFPDGKATDEHCFEWVFDRQFIRDRHVVRNGDAPYQGETLYGWDPEQKRLAFWYWNSEGEVLTGGVEYRPGAIVFPTRHVTEKGTIQLRATWTRSGQDGYRVEQSQRVGEAWKPLWTMELKRAPVTHSPTSGPRDPGFGPARARQSQPAPEALPAATTDWPGCSGRPPALRRGPSVGH